MHFHLPTQKKKKTTTTIAATAVATSTTTVDTTTIVMTGRAASNWNGHNRHIVPIPLLIMECYRLKSIRDDKTGHYTFHLANMPSVELIKFQIMGDIVEYEEWPNNFDLRVNDGLMKVRYKQYPDTVYPAKLGDFVTIAGFRNFLHDTEYIDGEKRL